MQEKKKQAYQQHVEQTTPKYSLPLRMCKAFLIGGLICLIGQIILNYSTSSIGLDKDTAGSWCSMLLVLVSVLLTGCNLYPKLVEWGGAGALVPITGFANAVVSPAIDFKSEGFVTGMAAKMFTVAGPVIVFGTVASVLYGVILKLFRL